ncbi:hypothetical protein EDD22DRAFT_845154 [Suillus occidentalis]|nr:hypothetical protein EDD22DRAFT_845154 [Suillus occidentalis]
MTQSPIHSPTTIPNHHGTAPSTHHPWEEAGTEDPKVVQLHIFGLRKKYRDFCTQLHLTGAGVMPLDETMQILKEFAWYDDLAAILGGNPAVSLKTVSSAPGTDHAANYFLLLQGGTAGNVQSSSSPQYGGYPPSVQPPLPPSVQLPFPPNAQPPPPAAVYNEHYAHPPSNTTYGGFPHCDSGKKQQLLTSSPLPPPTSPSKTEFRLPEKPQISLHNSCVAFGAPDPMRHSTPRSKSSAMNSTTPTSHSAGSNNSKWRPSKKAHSDMMSQVNTITDEIGSIKSERLDKVSHEELKNDHYMAKRNLTWQENKHQFLHAECMDECMDAATIHQRSQEAKDAEIHLHKAEMKMHESSARTHAEEAALLCLKIEDRQLMGGS